VQNERADKGPTDRKELRVLVAVDFSPYSVHALKSARSIMGQKPGRILVLHVIDEDFVERCVRNSLGSGEHIRKTLFLRAKARLQKLLRKEGMNVEGVEELVCEGTPFLEINKKAVQSGADMIVMGSSGNSADMKNIFFGSTAERVLRFMKRPVLCVPLDESHGSK
jgi:nucleotide-binding universal stress UspA family protein